MADETTTTATPEATPAAPPATAPPAQDPETRHAVESLEKKRSALGAPKPEAPSEAAKPAAPPEPPKPSAEEARRRYQERTQRRAQEQEAARQHYAQVEAENQRLLAEREQWARYVEEQFGPQEDSGLPVFEEDPKAWYQAAFDRALDERLSPILERFESYDAERQTHEERRAQAAQIAASHSQLVSFVGQAEEEYAATVEGSGYKERFDRFIRNTAQELKAAGRSDEQVVSHVFTLAAGLTQLSAYVGEHPAYFIDSLIRHHPLAQEGKGNGVPPPQNGTSLAPGRKSPVEELQKTAAAPGVSGSLSRGGAAEPSGAADVKALVRRGQVKTDDLRALVNAKAGTGTSVRARVREVMRQVESLADAQGK